MHVRKAESRLLGLLSALLVLCTAAGCTSGPAVSREGGMPRGGKLANIAAAWDILPLAQEIAGAHPEYGALASQTPIDDLRSGVCQAVLLGRDPSPEEIHGLSDQVVGYDAVCILVDENSYNGGTIAMQGVSAPLAHTAGLRDMTSQSVQNLVRNRVRLSDHSGDAWIWNGYERWTLFRDRSTGRVLRAENGQELWGWASRKTTLYPMMAYDVGHFDTQTVLCDFAQVDESSYAGSFTAYRSTPDLNTEEEVVSKEYDRLSGPFAVGGIDFSFKIGFLSRRVTVMAFEHTLPIAVISVGGIDPIRNTDAIYDGSYPLARRIHLLTRKDAPPVVTDLAKLLLEPQGQALVSQARFMPLPQ